MRSTEVSDRLDALRRISEPLYLVDQGQVSPAGVTGPVSGMILPCPLEKLGDPSFCRDHKLRYAYVGGSMAKGISSVSMVKAFAHQGMLGFFGSAGLSLEAVDTAIEQLRGFCPDQTFGVNLIHSPSEPELEKALVELYIQRGVKLIEASAFLALTLPVVRYRTHGIYRNSAGQVIAPNRIIAKVSREEVAARFFAPPAEKFLNQLVDAGELTAEQAEMAGEIPVAQDVTVEADSGGHTDNRPALALFPTIKAQCTEFQQRYNYTTKLRVGLGGGIATPASAAAAFAMGAAYLVTGTVNQACRESGTCDEVRAMLAETRQADITMAPSGDMFEMGVKVQVVKRGTMFAIRAHKLYDLYRSCDSIDSLPVTEREKLEKTFFRAPLTAIWDQTKEYFSVRDPRQVEKAEADPKYKLALVFRWYLGQSPDWANRGEESRKIDYQIWCGPAMGAFNEWAKGSFLEQPQRRDVATVAYNLLYGAALMKRADQYRQQVDSDHFLVDAFAPMTIEQIKEYLS
ncbi:MAG: PfaD family polyunsaturated fatty acid/polyketide biosynthesis protein [Desulfuromonadales bacterium]|nr:PfaD family polyunsaturated fatty acid/polyketide biosynthesis protein [Desulfuromonadales bacterium]MBN2793168.1 PfaD family polyunsaturated fatty acid/polyketide biosynthesis protein [Desulfuromonadales bacterium]